MSITSTRNYVSTLVLADSLLGRLLACTLILAAVSTTLAYADDVQVTEDTVIADQQLPPKTQVERFHEALMASARLDGGYDERVALLGAEFDRVFDLPRIARISAGSSWRELDAPTKNEYLELLRNVVLGTYVSRFDADRGQLLEVLEATEVKPGRDLVRAQIVRPSGASVALGYYLRDNKVFNVEADGVSDLSIRRADYSSIIKAEGFAGLLSHLKTQAANSRRSFVAARP